MHRFITLPLMLCLLLTGGCASLIFHPSRAFVANPVHDRFPHQDICFTAEDGVSLHAWFFPASGEARGTVLVMHGNAENLSTHVNTVLWLVQEGFNLFIFDYRGFGRSGGTPSLPGVHLDAAAALEQVLTMPEASGKGVVVLGQSIGGAIAVHTLATSPHRREVALLALDSTPAGYRLIAREKLSGFFLTWPLQYPLSWLFDDDYSPIRSIGSLAPLPLVVIHGEEDKVIPPHHGRLLYTAAGEPKEFWPSATPGHVTSFADPALRRRFVDTISARLSPRPPQGSR
jgi:fermentation-respiration switch protein FrsA (DUF1100 family)